MYLALGNFSPEVDFDLINDSFSAIEIDVLSYFRWKIKDQKKLELLIEKRKLKIIPKLNLRQLKTMEEWAESYQIWSDLFFKHQIFFICSSGFRSWNELRDEVKIHGIKKINFSSPLFFEWGIEDDIRSTRFLYQSGKAGAVLDPAWHSSAAKKEFPMKHYKLHGWYDERWIRRYGEKQIQQIVKKNISQDSVLTLAYSGRYEESSIFSKAEAQLRG